GIGLGGEQPMGGTFVAEEWPEDRRKMGAGYMHTGYYFGFFLAAIANYYIGANYGWRWMFILGRAPALLVGRCQCGGRAPANGPGSATIIGCLMAPWLAERFGRRTAMGIYFTALGAAVAAAFGYVFYTPMALTTFFVLIFFLGIGGANFAMYTLWLPEQYATS